MQEQGTEFDERRLDRGLSEEELDRLIGGRDYRLFLNPRNEVYRERGMADNPPPRAEALKMMAREPNLVRRPILVRGSRFVLGFDAEKYREILG